MKKQKHRFGYLVVGVLIGFLIAWSIIWWQGSSSANFQFFKNVRNYISNLFSSKEKDDVTTISDDETKNNPKKYTELTAQQKNDSAYYDSTNFGFSNPDALDEFLAMYNGQLPDSILFDSIVKNQKITSNTSGNIQVKKDKLISLKTFNVPGIGQFFSDTGTKADSLLSGKSQVFSMASSDIIRVEFWKSPINYKGYKTGKNKVILFGIDQPEAISFKILDDVLYFKYLSDFYQIDRSMEFRSLIPVSNSNTVSQLNSK